MNRTILPVLMILCSCLFSVVVTASDLSYRVKREATSAMIDGKPVEVYEVRNSNGIEVRAMNFGGIIISLRVPDKSGKMGDVVLGYDDVTQYRANPAHMGGIIGRYANRIAHGEFTLDGKQYPLAKNNGSNSLHGGIVGFDKVFWDAKPFTADHEAGIVFTYTSKDGEEGYPGNLKTKVTYTLNDHNELIFDYEAVTDKATPINLTQHTYFNLAGEGNGDILGEQVMIQANAFTRVDKTMIPTGEIRPVKDTPLDLTKPTKIGAKIHDGYEQLAIANGYDHNFIIDGKEGELKFAARLIDPVSGRVLEVSTTQPGIQFYSGNSLDGTIVGKNGHVYKQNFGFALETQHYPDSPNHPNFPSTILRPGQTFHSRTVYKFSVE
jgi:aldose 1-epimerase